MSGGTPPASLELPLPFRAPLRPDNLFGHLAATAVPGVEEWREGWYRRTLRLPHGAGIVALSPRADHIACRLMLADRRDNAAAVARCRWLLDLDADPDTIDRHLESDPHLAALVRAAPGRRVPRAADPAEFAIRAVLGQQVSTAAARTHAGRLVIAYGTGIEDPSGGLTHLFPTPGELSDLDPAALALPAARRRTLVTLIAALASGTLALEPDEPHDMVRERLHALPGFGPWTVETIMMRGLGDPDAFPGSDLGVVRAAAALDLPTTRSGLERTSQPWRPWRAYAVQHLWATGEHPINRLPG